ncbi:MAG: organomercurial lyase [Acidimicrobiales bacterium]
MPAIDAADGSIDDQNPSEAELLDTDCGLPEIRVSDRHRQVQAAAFALLLEVGEPLTREKIMVRAGSSEAEVAELLADFDAAGRVRFDEGGRVVGIAGLSLQPTRHRLQLGDTTRWTWCALDAIGILGALGRDATFTTVVPDSDQELTVEFTAAGPQDTDAVVFMADGYGSDSVVETWCPTVNLFPDSATANTWAAEHGVTGNAIPVADLAKDAAAMWAPVTGVA